MSKVVAQSPLKVEDVKNGKSVIVRGAGALKDRPLPIRSDIDLTKPIAAQVLHSTDR
jgi:hypothetical protein